MTKEQLGIKNVGDIFKGNGKLEKFHDFQSINNYFSDLSMDDLEGKGRQRGINNLT